MTVIAGVNPRTGEALPSVVNETESREVAEIAAAAKGAAAGLSGTSREQRAQLLDAIAAGIDAQAVQLVQVAMQETGFPEAKLIGEAKRAAYQFRFFGDVVREGSFLEAAIDHAGQTPAGPRPDLRRLLLPLGPVAVFGSSNFPFAFSVLGGDTASALAAGNPVVIKAHPSHPETSMLSFAILQNALSEIGLAPACVGIVHGRQAGLALVTHPAVSAVGFTGSLSGGQALLAAIGTRQEPIPFYGELSSINPVVVSPRAAAERGATIGAAYAASLSMGAGQFCTKPGLLLAPTGSGGDDLVARTASDLAASQAHFLLNEGIHRVFQERTNALAASDRVSVVVPPSASSGPGFEASPALFEVSVEELERVDLAEIFGPASIVIRYDPDALENATRRILDVLPASLTVTLHLTEDDTAEVETLTPLALARCGRLVFNGFPTGVAVAWAQNHGGPWPSTNSLHTSVGATAIRRFLRPITFQDAPLTALPPELRDDFTAIPRRVDGVIVVSSPHE